MTAITDCMKLRQENTMQIVTGQGFPVVQEQGGVINSRISRENTYGVETVLHNILMLNTIKRELGKHVMRGVKRRKEKSERCY